MRNSVSTAKLNEEPENRLTQAIKLLEEAHNVLESRWFITAYDDEYNDDEVIEVDKKIIRFLKGDDNDS